jgi:hypothetical protein
MRTIDDVLNAFRADTAERRLRAQYAAVPGLRLTLEQVQRLCGVERALCGLVVGALVDAKFLCLKADGRYARCTDGEMIRPRASRLNLRPEQRSVRAS